MYMYVYDVCICMYVYVYIIYTVYIRCFWQENHQIYGHIRCIYTVLANPINALFNLCVVPGW